MVLVYHTCVTHTHSKQKCLASNHALTRVKVQHKCVVKQHATHTYVHIVFVKEQPSLQPASGALNYSYKSHM